jgi:prevent-host-death family protein
LQSCLTPAYRQVMARIDIQWNFPPEFKQITARELSRNTAHVLARVEEGETIGVTRNGETVAMLSPPDIEEITVRRLIRTGVLPPDWREQQAELRQFLRDYEPPPTPPGQRPLSELLIEMRDEETH